MKLKKGETHVRNQYVGFTETIRKNIWRTKKNYKNRVARESTCKFHPYCFFTVVMNKRQ